MAGNGEDKEVEEMLAEVQRMELQAKSLYRSRAQRHFYGTENYIWAGFGPVGNTEKKNWNQLQ